MPQSASPNEQASADWLEAAADQAIAACGGDAREAVKALIVANDFLESEISTGYVRGYKHGRIQDLHRVSIARSYLLRCITLRRRRRWRCGR